MKPIKTSLKLLLLTILLFVGITSVLGGYGLISGSTKLPVQLLEKTPFFSYFWPGMILAFVVGGTHLVAALLTIRNHRQWHEASATAGFAILIWIFVELYMMQHSFFLQLVYFTLGITTLVLTAILCKYFR